MPRVDVIVLNFNGRRFLEECLFSLQQQTYQDFEVLLVDNASSDDSVEFVRSTFPNVKLLQLSENLGFCGGNNRGISSTSADYVALLNNDTQADPNWLESLVSVLDHEPQVGFCASKMIRIQDRLTIDTAGDVFYTHGVGGKRGSGLPISYYTVPEYIFGACAGAAIYRRAMLDVVGLLDEDFFAYDEDIDLSFRCQLQGYRCKYVPTAIVYHHVGGSFGRLSEDNVKRIRRNMLEVVLKNLPTRLLVRYLPRIMTYFLLGDLRYAFGGYGRAVIHARYENFCRLSLTLCKRRGIQSERRATDTEIKSILTNQSFFSWGNTNPSSPRGTIE